MSGPRMRSRGFRCFRRGAARLSLAVCVACTLGTGHASETKVANAAAAESATTRVPVPAVSATPATLPPAAMQRLAAISAELRCLVCQNESLAGSQADLAKDLRREILGMIEAGRSDAEIVDFMVGRYGDFVRYRPPLKPSTWLLWAGPFLLLAGGLGGLFAFLRCQGRRAAAPPLSAEDKRRAERLLAGEEPPP